MSNGFREALKSLAVNAPTGVALIVVVVLFLRFVDQDHTRFATSLKDLMDRFERIELREIETLDRLRISIESTTRVIEERNRIMRQDR